MRVEAAKAAFLRACAVRNEAYQHRTGTRRRLGEVLTKFRTVPCLATMHEADALEQELACAETRFQQASAERDEMRVKALIDPAG